MDDEAGSETIRQVSIESDIPDPNNLNPSDADADDPNPSDRDSDNPIADDDDSDDLGPEHPNADQTDNSDNESNDPNPKSQGSQNGKRSTPTKVRGPHWLTDNEIKCRTKTTTSTGRGVLETEGYPQCRNYHKDPTCRKKGLILSWMVLHR